MASEHVLAYIECVFIRFTPLDELASTLKAASKSTDGTQPKNSKLQKGNSVLSLS